MSAFSHFTRKFQGYLSSEGLTDTDGRGLERSGKDSNGMEWQGIDRHNREGETPGSMLLK